LPQSLEVRLDAINTTEGLDHLCNLNHGIEKESLRVSNDGLIAQTAHPQALGSALTHSYITTDYSEALLEFITPTFTTNKEALDFLAKVHGFVCQNLDDEIIWANSMPCQMGADADIPLAQYGSSNIGRLKTVYREGLGHRYGRTMQTIAGIHFNFSLPKEFWPYYQNICSDKQSEQDFRSQQYFGLIRNFRRNVWLLMYLFGASPALCQSFLKDREHQLEKFDDQTLYLPYATSLRMSDLGYQNAAQSNINICYNTLDNYIDTLDCAMQTPHQAYEKIGAKQDGKYRQLNTNILQIENEFYSVIRPKRVTQPGEKPLQALRRAGLEYVEVRCVDINPFLPMGMDEAQANFLDTFLLACLFNDSPYISAEECQLLERNQELSVTQGRDPNLMLFKDDQTISLQDWGNEVLDQCLQVAKLMDNANGNNTYTNAVATQRQKIQDPRLTPSAMVLDEMKKQGLTYFQFGMQQSQKATSLYKGQPLAPADQTRMTTASVDSLDQQTAIEEADQISFSQFLKEYNSN